MNNRLTHIRIITMISFILILSGCGGADEGDTTSEDGEIVSTLDIPEHVEIPEITLQPTVPSLVPVRPIPAMADYLDALVAGAAADPDEALRDLDALIEAEPGYMDAYFARGVLREDTGDTLGAYQDYTLLIGISPDYAPAYFRRAGLFLLREELVFAMNDLNAGLAADPEAGEGYFERAKLFDSMGEPQAAKADYEAALVYGVKEEAVFLRLSELYLEDGAPEAAQTMLEGALADGFIGRELRYMLALADFQLGEFGKSLALIEVLLEEELEAIDALSLKGTIYLNTDDWSGAARIFRQVLEIDPGYLDAYYGLAQALWAGGDAVGALEALNAYLANADVTERNYTAVLAFREIILDASSG